MSVAVTENLRNRQQLGSDVIALVFSYDVTDPAEFERAYGPEGEWAQFFRSGAATSAPSS